MSLRTPLGRVLGRGSAKSGSAHWWTQRLSAIALIPLTLWFAISLSLLPALDYATVSAWLAGTWTAILASLLVLVLAHHSNAGVQVVIEDYVQDHGLKLIALVAVTFAHCVIAAAGVFAVLRVGLGSVA